MAKDWSNVAVFAPNEYPPDSLLVSDVPKVLRLIMDRMNSALPDLYRQGVRVGTIIPWYWNPLPDGALECNGQQYDTSKFPDLFDILKTNHVPDLRGLFMRGWANGSTTYDPDGATRQLGSIQQDATQKVTGHFIADIAKIEFAGKFVDGVFTDTGGVGGGDGDSVEWQEIRKYLFDNSKVVRTSSEDRPKNIATRWVIIAIGSNRLIDGTVNLTDINLSPSPITGSVGSSGILVPTAVPINAPLGQLTFTAGDPTIVTVNAVNGQYTLIKKGFTTITVNNQDGISRSVAVNVMEALTGIDVTFPSVMNMNSVEYPIVTVTPEGSEYSLTYEIVNNDGMRDYTYASVSLDGKVATNDVEGQTNLRVTATGLDGSVVSTIKTFQVVRAISLISASIEMQKEIPVGTQAVPTLVINPAGLQVIVDWDVTYNPIFGTTVAIADPSNGTVTGLYANAPAVLNATVRDLQGTIRKASFPFVVTNASWFVEKVYCRMDIVPAGQLFSNGELFKVRIIDKLGVMDFTQISNDYLTGYAADADLMSTSKSPHAIEYTLKFKDNTPAGTVLQLDWLPTEATKNPSDTGWPSTGDDVELCQCRNWNATSNGVNSVGVPKLKLTYVNGYDTYNGQFKEAIIIDENGFLDFTEHHGSNSVTSIGVVNGGNEVVTAGMVRVPRIYFSQGTPVGSTGGIRWTSSLNSSWFIQDLGLTSIGNMPEFVIEFNTVEDATYRATVNSTNGDNVAEDKDRVLRCRIRDANLVTDFTSLQAVNDWTKFTFNNTYRVGNMTVTAAFVEFEIRLNNNTPVDTAGGITWQPNNLVTVTSNGIVSTGDTIADLEIKVMGDLYEFTCYNTQRIPVLVWSPTGKYDMASGTLQSTNANVSVVMSTNPPIVIDGSPYLPGFLVFNTAATEVQSVALQYDPSDSVTKLLTITGLGSKPTNTNTNRNNLVINIPKQFSELTGVATFYYN